MKKSNGEERTKDRLNFAFERTTPYELATKLLYSASEAGFSHFALLVRSTWTPLPGKTLRQIRLHTPRIDPETGGVHSAPISVAVRFDGIQIDIIEESGTVPPVANCPDSGPTLCLREASVAVENLARQLQSARRNRSSRKQLNGLEEKLLDGYRWKALYETLVEVKQDFPDESRLEVALAPELPVSLAVRVMDVARFRLERETFRTRESFHRAFQSSSVERKDLGMPKPIFNRPYLAILK